MTVPRHSCRGPHIEWGSVVAYEATSGRDRLQAPETEIHNRSRAIASVPDQGMTWSARGWSPRTAQLSRNRLASIRLMISATYHPDLVAGSVRRGGSAPWRVPCRAARCPNAAHRRRRARRCGRARLSRQAEAASAATLARVRRFLRGGKIGSFLRWAWLPLMPALCDDPATEARAAAPWRVTPRGHAVEQASSDRGLEGGRAIAVRNDRHECRGRRKLESGPVAQMR